MEGKIRCVRRAFTGKGRTWNPFLKDDRSTMGGGVNQKLLDALFLGVPSYEGVKDGEDVTAVFDHAVEDVAKFRVALGVAVPLQQNGGRHLDIAAQLLWGMTSQKQAIEESRFPLRKREVCGDFYRNDLGYRGHKEKCSLPKSVSASSGTVDLVSLGG
jgi:hypothetical protein